MRDQRDDRAGWLRVALAAGAGLASLVGCSGAFVAIFLLLFVGPGGYMVWLGRLNLPLFLFGVVVALLLALASLSLPALALGARGGRLTKTALLSGLGFCAFVFFLIVSLGGNVAFVLFALMALVGISVVSPLIAVQGEESHSAAIRLGRAIVIAAVTIFCASLLAYWWAYGAEDCPYYFAPLIVASSSWAVVPGIVAVTRSG